MTTRDDPTPLPDDDIDGLVTIPGVRSGAGPEKAGTPEQAADERREAAAPDPAEADVASDEYPAVPHERGVTDDQRSSQ